MEDNARGAKVLTEALPYIQKYYGKTIVVKYGGAAMINEELKALVTKDVVLLSLVGINVVLVHGGGPEISQTLSRMGKESVFVNGLRYTDAETADVAAMVLAGKVNKGLVSLIHSYNGKAVGLCGVDGGMLLCERLAGETDLGFVGDVVKVSPAAIDMTIAHGFIPVVATIGVDARGQVYNVNADTAAAAIAGAMKAEKLISMTDVRGVLEDAGDEGTLIPEIDVAEVPGMVARGVISGGMIPKIESCVEAIRNGLKEAVIIDGRVEHSILLELFSDKGSGTLFRSGGRAGA
ncbi:MAG: acetylglutamate kinase [Clostridiales Family XIII bacterium]|jgi:acetylglutamate kinase|nr:acetylglutamate kinase [Clostridiales Family XIII bacterium]